MLEIITHNYFLFRRKEVWFYNGEAVGPAGYTVFSAAKKPAPGTRYAFLEKYFTSSISLSSSADELLSAIHPTYRYDIRTAEKKGITIQSIFTPSLQDCQDAVNGYNLFADGKALKKMNLPWLLALQKKGCLCITRALQGKETVVTHIYIFDDKTISLISSFNNVNFTDEKTQGVANKLLHWKDLLHFKERGFTEYDFGGLNPQKLPGVSKFKTNFGGKTIENFRFIRAWPLVFRMINMLKKA